MQRDPDLAAYVRRMYDVFNSGEVGAYEELFSREEDSLSFGTAPDEAWFGEAVIRAFKTQLSEMHAAGIQFEAGEIHAHREGSVGWIADRPTIRTPDGGEVSTRLTAVCHQEDGMWKMVQSHFSIGVGNEESIGEELTI